MKKETYLKNIIFYFYCILIGFYLLFPFYWTLVTSFRNGSQLFSTHLFPLSIDFDNYFHIFTEQPFGKNILNSILTALSTVSVSLFFGILASYALARKRFTGRKMILYSFLLISIFPQVAILAGLFELIRALGLYNTVIGLTLSYMIFTLPFTIWTLTTFMQDIPRGIEEAAIMDGARPIIIIIQIFIPIMAPSMISAGLLAFIAAWNEFLFALTFTLSDKSRTVPVAIAFMSGGTEHELPWGNIMAASITVTVPLILLVILFQKRLISGLTGGAIKG